MKNTIQEVENGPLILETDTPVLEKNGEIISSESPAYLCRCGTSNNKPFCDGEHEKSGFISKREIDKELVYEYEGKEITINFNRSICAGTGSCVRRLPSVFLDGESKDWIHPDKDSVDEIINTINTCPSGALSYTFKNKTYLDNREVSKVSIVKDGPYSVEGISCSSGCKPTRFSETKYTLCRCGHSKNKPYCDYSHAKQKWTDE
ncbi:MAG: CDGSH-type Zn-finger protein/ferredoxin [Sulfurimonas sp.]|jgi:CDGSH-type Zn-finger protein/ferredoxin|uniref:CDGSH iron-sulfur domain-containing protein n=1 Tax=Sulfurimonas sp. TaxID=2022749 RepID=UPI0039E373A3